MKFNLDQLKEDLRQELPSLTHRFSVKSLAIFGSVAHGNLHPNDVDLLIEFDQTPSLFGFIALENYLSEFLGIKVDLAMRDSLKPRIGRRILQEMIVV